MSKFIDWETFRDSAVEVLQSDPFASRLTVKYNHKRGVCLLKVTNDKKWLRTKLTNIADFTKIEQFVNATSRILSNQFEDIQQQLQQSAMEEEAGATTPSSSGDAKKFKQTQKTDKNKKVNKKN